MKRMILCAVSALLMATVSWNCSSPVSPWWEAVPQAPALTVATVTVTPAAVNGGTILQGVVALTQNAPSGGAVVSLSSNNPAANVPASVTVPTGSKTANFNITTSTVSADVVVGLTASMAGQSRQSVLSVWSADPISIWAATDPGTANYAQYHYTSATARFDARCNGNFVTLTVFPFDGSLSQSSSFSMPAPFNPGAFDVSSTQTAFTPSMSPAPSTVCFSRWTGHFEVKEFDATTTGIIRRLVLTFEKRCEGDTGSLRGEIVLTNPPVSPFTQTCFR